jgi:hypothetical protein
MRGTRKFFNSFRYGFLIVTVAFNNYGFFATYIIKAILGAIHWRIKPIQGFLDLFPQLEEKQNMAQKYSEFEINTFC